MKQKKTTDSLNEFLVKNIKTTSFHVNEIPLNASELKDIKLNISQESRVNQDEDLFQIHLKVSYNEPKTNQLLAEIQVENTFIVPRIREFMEINKSNVAKINLDTELLIEMMSSSLHHTRALFMNTLSNTIYSSVALPIFKIDWIERELVEPKSHKRT